MRIHNCLADLPKYRKTENNAKQVADSIKERILLMPQGQGAGKISGMVGKLAKMHLDTLPGQAGRMKVASHTNMLHSAVNKSSTLLEFAVP